MKKVATLYRVSTVKQLKDEEDSIPVQKHFARAYLDNHPEMFLVAEYSEEGVSAFKKGKDDRDVLRAVLADAAQGKFEVLLVFKADRLSRQSIEYPLVLDQLHKAGVDVIALADAPGGRVLSIDDQTDKLLRFMEGWLAESESRNTSIRTKAAMTHMAESGKWMGGKPPYGFRPTQAKGTIEIDPIEAEVVKTMVRLYKDGLGYKRVAVWLNEHSFRTRRGFLWESSHVRLVLQNPTIAGVITWGRWKNSSLSNCTVARDDKGQPVANLDLAIIPLDEWYALIHQSRQRSELSGWNRPAEKGPSARAMMGNSLLTGFLRCGYCRAAMVTSGAHVYKRRRADGSYYSYVRRFYMCNKKRSAGSSQCESQGHYSQNKIDGLFLREVETFLSQLDVSGLEEMVSNYEGQRVAQLQGQLRTLEKEGKKLDQVCNAWVARLDQYFAEPSASMYSEKLLAQKVKEYTDLLDQRRSDMERLRGELHAAKASRSSLEEFVSMAPRWLSVFMDASIEKKKDLLKILLSTVEVYKDKLVINYDINLLAFVNRHREAQDAVLKLSVVSNY